MYYVAMSRTLLYLILTENALSSRVSRLEKRVNLVERKLFQDTYAFREDIAMIQETLETISNSTSEISQRGKIEQEYSVSNSGMKTLHGDTLRAVKNTMREEKQYLRNILNEVTAETELIRKTFAETENIIVEKQHVQDITLKAVQNSIANLETQMQHNIEGLKKTIAKISENILIKTEMNKQFTSLREESHREKDHFNSKISELERKLSVLSSRQCSDPLWTSYGASCYYVGTDGMAWDDAYRKCLTYGAKLAEVDDGQENAFLIQLIKQKGVGGWGVWLGGTDLAIEGLWKWDTSKREINKFYSNFKGAEPNGGTSENCLMFYRANNWAWNDSICSTKTNYICERERLDV